MSASSTEEFRQHKKRQRHRNQERKQLALDELLQRVPPIPSSLLCQPCESDSPTLVTSLYRPIPSLEQPDQFWEKVPDSCNPHATVLNSKIVADAYKMATDKYHVAKYERKLRYKAERGEITKEEQGELWKLHGRTHHQQSPSSESKTDEPTQSDNAIALLSASRGQRKAWQVENIVQLIHQQLLQPKGDYDQRKNPLTVVDFGCGSGNLCLALAAYYPHVRFVLVDKNPYPLQLVQRRAEEAGLLNVQVQQFKFSPENLKNFETPPIPASFASAEDETKTPDPAETSMSHETKQANDRGSFDLGIGLHSCGSFTDMVMELCHMHGADCLVCPCCNGGMKGQATGGYHYPRSRFLQGSMSQDEYLQQLSKSADDRGNYAAKCWVECDRAMWAQEQGFQVGLWKMTPEQCTPKHHVLYLRNQVDK